MTGKALWVFPGQGSFDRALLRQLYVSHRELRPLFYAVDEAAGDALGAPLLPSILDPAEPPLPDPDLDQLGIYLANVAAARLWRDRGYVPAALAGHSFGELAAFTVAGVYAEAVGARVVCQRVLSLREAARPGGMLAVLTGAAETARIIAAVAPSAVIAVVNHSRQTVVSAPHAELKAIIAAATAQRISTAPLQSRYPFHSPLLDVASRAFRIALRGHRVHAPSIPVMVGTDLRWLAADMDLADVMARQLTAPLDFPAQLTAALVPDITHILECGAGEIVSKIAARVLRESGRTLSLVATFPAGMAPAAALAAAQHAMVSGEPAPRDGRTTEAPQATAVSPAMASARVEATPAIDAAVEPIAIVGMGCVLPGAATDPDVFWQHLRDGVNGIVDLTVGDPHAREDFVAGDASHDPVQIVSDKTYTLLNGSIPRVGYDAALLGGSYSAEAFARLTKGQQLLATALAQALRGAPAAPGQRMQCILGSTADGVGELDEAHFAESVREAMAGLSLTSADAEAFADRMAQGLCGWAAASDRLRPYDLYAAVAQTLAGVPASQTYLVDSACSSSLYSITLGARALRSGAVDVVYAGGVFAPGPANNNLFAQFRGLTPTGSRPLDASADGVVFGDGAGVVVLRRLSAAIASGQRILAVLRTDGASSDGKSPSINVPQAEGQAVAMQAAYRGAGVDADSVQYVEAHATATPVGDAVEFKALCRAFPPRRSGAPRWLGSVKSLIGHTGWTSGVASVIKICQALAHRQIPKQYGYTAPNPQIALDGSGFAIPTRHEAWPDNDSGWPRRAAINSFGFGGTNAHVVLEEYVEPYHRTLAAHFGGQAPAPPAPLVVVGVAGLFPERGRAFDRSALRMPRKRMVLPDVAEHMDASQYLATMAAEQLTQHWPADVTGAGTVRIGVALGLESKTERGIRANERIFLDRLSRIAKKTGASASVVQQIREAITHRVIPSGPYSLPGLMPNVAASRITHTFNWRGPNIVIDQGTTSLAQAMATGAAFVRAGDCDVVLAGAVHAWTGHAHESREAAVLVGLATVATAERLGLPQLARLTDGHDPSAVVKALDTDAECRGATGAAALHQMLVGFEAHPAVYQLTAGGESRFGLGPVKAAGTAAAPVPPPAVVPAPASAPAVAPASGPTQTVVPPAPAKETHAYVQDTPITNYTPVLEPAAMASGAPAAWQRCLVIVDQPEVWHRWQQSGVLAHLSCDVVVPSGIAMDDALVVDTTSEDSLARSLTALASRSYDAIVGLRDVSDASPDALLHGSFDEHRRWLDVVFALARDRYEPIGQGTCAFVTLCLGAWKGAHLDPWTGMAAGLMKSVARERPTGLCRAMATDVTDPAVVLPLVLREGATHDGLPEIVYRDGQRHAFALRKSEPLHRPGTPWLTPGAVVIATGGGRGVTAVLAEWMVQQGPCTVIALGRTDPDDLPEELRHLTPDEFLAGETAFYVRERTRDATKKMPELKRLYERYQASHEVASVMARTRRAAGTYRYEQCDISDAAAVGRLVDRVMAEYGRVDMVLHGAGVQVSKMLPRKSLGDFQRIVSTKLDSLSHLYQACARHGLSGRVHMHLLTSAFSYLGNDGQPDYGAANETLNRLASCMNGTGGAYWSSFAWLGWAGIGMTRGSEYAALAANRRLRGVTREEGQSLFADAMAGPPADPVNVILADGEVAFYQPRIVERPAATASGTVEAPVAASAVPPSAPVPAPSSGAPTLVREWAIDPQAMPFLADHAVRGVPTVPGALLITMAGEAAQAVCPHLKIQQFERTRFVRLVRASGVSPTPARVVATVVESSDTAATVQVQVLMDFVHKSGRVLGANLLHTEIFVRLGPTWLTDASLTMPEPEGRLRRLPDPYVLPGSPVQLDGMFRAMAHVDVGEPNRRAPYQWPGITRYQSAHDALLPTMVLVDAFWRFGTVRQCTGDRLGVYVPERCDVMKVYFDWSSYTNAALVRPITLAGANPRPDGEVLHVGPITAFDEAGRPLLRVEGGLCRKFGELDAVALA
jgi:acyl transferase domain-containing protein/NAD(P)-dependent dehydrogenase (short-subunit alcohol dehydrogenase family)